LNEHRVGPVALEGTVFLVSIWNRSCVKWSQCHDLSETHEAHSATGSQRIELEESFSLIPVLAAATAAHRSSLSSCCAQSEYAVVR